jgi:hypothetical protein
MRHDRSGTDSCAAPDTEDGVWRRDDNRLCTDDHVIVDDKS